MCCMLPCSPPFSGLVPIDRWGSSEGYTRNHQAVSGKLKQLSSSSSWSDYQAVPGKLKRSSSSSSWSDYQAVPGKLKRLSSCSREAEGSSSSSSWSDYQAVPGKLKRLSSCSREAVGIIKLFWGSWRDLSGEAIMWVLIGQAPFELPV